jgi:hypothetical protein
MALISKPPLSRSEREHRSIMDQLFLRWVLGFLIPVAFFFGAEYAKRDTASGYQALIGQMPPTCQESFERIVTHEVSQ